MNRAIYTASEKITKPTYIALYEEYLYYVPWAKKINMKLPIKIVFTNIEVDDGVVLGGVWELAVPKSSKLDRHMITKTALTHCVFKLEDEQKLNALYCKAMLFYHPHRIKKKDQKFINEFTEKYPELMV
jgi:phage tail tube protein FII